jgi:molybdate transport system ATP-binding protein
MNNPDYPIKTKFSHRLSNANREFTLDIDLKLPAQGISVFFGKSGSGKSTFLRCCAGLEIPHDAHIAVANETWADKGSMLPAHKRAIGYAYQEGRLFPHLSVEGNLLYAKKRSWQTVDEILYQSCIDIFELAPLLSSDIASLSGGEKQRCSLARALLMQGKLLLMDEPLSAIDSERKRKIIPFIRAHAARSNIPVFYVTHSVEEMAQIADHIVIIDQGNIITQGPYADILSSIEFSRMFSEYAGTVIEAKKIEYDRKWNMSKAIFSGGELWLNGTFDKDEARIQIFARDVSLSTSQHSDSSILNRIPVTVKHIASHQNSASALVQLEAGSDTIVAHLTRRSVEQMNIQPGARFWAQIKSVAILS